MKKILQIDGGGIKGVIPAKVLKDIEYYTQKPLCKMFDLMTGTSTGAILAGCLSTGVSASVLCDMYVKEGKKLFDSRTKWNPYNWFRPKYSKVDFMKTLNTLLGSVKMSEAKAKLILATFNLCSQRTHFISSLENKELQIKDAIAWSALSAAYYFGKINCPDYEWFSDDLGHNVKGAVWQDGGQGINNCTLYHTLTELAKEGLQEDVFILSIGCGNQSLYVPYSEANKESFFGQILEYPMQATTESTICQVRAFNYISKHNQKVKFIRLDCQLPKNMDKLDAVNHINDFYFEGQKLSYSLLQNPTFVEIFK